MSSLFKISLFSILILSLIVTSSISSVAADGHVILSPKKQMASGVAAEDVMCKSGLVLMIRATNGDAACVKESTSMKLSGAGWGEIIEKSMDEVMHEDGNDKEIILEEELSMGEPDQMGNDTTTVVELEEGISAGEEDKMGEEAAEDVFSIGGVDLSMAVLVEGNPDAPITIIEFGDYQCPKCKQWFQNEKPTISSTHISTDTAKLYFVDSAWLGDDSILAAQASHCAGDQEKFKEYHSTLYNNQADIQGGWASSTSLKQFATDLELDSETFDECLDTGKYTDKVVYNTQVGISNGVQGTPHFIIVGPDGDTKTFSGALPSAAFDAAILSLGY